MLLLCQGCLIVAALYLSMLVTFAYFAGASSLHRGHYPNYAIILVAGLLIESISRDPEKEAVALFRRKLMEQHSLSLRQTLFSVGCLFLYLAAFKDAFVSRTVLALGVPLIYFVLLISNALLPRLLAKYFFVSARSERTLLVGEPALAKRLLSWLREKELFGFNTLGLLSDQRAEDCGSLPRLGETGELGRVLKDEQISLVIFLGLPASAGAHQQMVKVAESGGARVLILSDLEERLRHRVVHLQDSGFSFIAPRLEPLEDPLNQLTKRALDIAVALPVVLLICPLVAVLVWVLHRWQSPGPLLFRQVRAGIQNRKFTLWKFRSMHIEAPQSEENDQARTFPAGDWLRRSSLDELPQFFNVLMGDMSVCGPRPHLIKHNAAFAEKMGGYHLRAFVKPGVTGLAQVRGFRGDVRTVDNIEHRLESDIAYIENWRLLLDVAIIFRTALQLVLFSVNGIFRSFQQTAVPDAPEVVPVVGRTALQSVRRAYLSEATRRSFRRILGIRFFTGDAHEAVALGMEGGLVVAPSAPVLLGLEKDPAQRAAVCGSALAITDSGFMVLAWKLLTGEAIVRVSGLAYLKLLLEQPAMKAAGSTFWVMPSETSAQHHATWLRAQGFSVEDDDFYVAPHFEGTAGRVEDAELVRWVQSRRPAQVIMAIGGGVQEKLGAFLLTQLDYAPAVHCTGAAIGFLSGEQAKIPNWADQFRLGWLYRCLHEPAKFVPRYWEARKLLSLMLHYHGRLPGPVRSEAFDRQEAGESLLTPSTARVSPSS